MTLSAPEPTPPTEAPGSPSSPARLMNRDFFLLWQGQLVSRLGDQAFLIAMMFWTKQATGSSSVMGLLMMLSMLPAALLSPVGGTVADRHSRYGIIVGADLVRGMAVLALAGLMLYSPGETGWILAALFVVAVTGGVVGSLFMPAITAAIPDLVPREKVAAANSVNQLSAQGAVFLGQALGGVLFRLLGAPLLFLIDGVSYLLSALSEAFIRIPQKLPEKSRGLKTALATYARETGDGLAWVWRRRGMRTFLLSAATLNFFATPLFVLLPFYVTDTLGRGAEWYGFLLAALGVGSATGYVVAGSLQPGGRARVGIGIAALAGTGAGIGVTGFIASSGLALVLFFAIGVLTGMINILVLTLFQISTPGEMRGRVMGLVMAMSSAAMPLGMALSGVMGDLTGQNLRLLFGVSGGAVVLASLWATSRPSFREFLGQETARETNASELESQAGPAEINPL